MGNGRKINCKGISGRRKSRQSKTRDRCLRRDKKTDRQKSREEVFSQYKDHLEKMLADEQAATTRPLPGAARAETGPMAFGEDWPGLFVRGDAAMYFAAMLRAYLQDIERHGPASSLGRHFARNATDGLLSLLESSNVRNKPKVQSLKPWGECHE